MTAEHNFDPVPTAGGGDPGDVDLAELWRTVADAKWLVLSIAALALLVASTYIWLATPVYESDLLIQVEERAKGLGSLSDLAPAFGGAVPAAAEMEIIRSRTILGSAVDKLRLDIEARPAHFPLVGAALARGHSGDGLAAPRWGLTGNAWGGERIQVARLDLPPAWEGRPLTLVAGLAGTYELRDPDGHPLLHGRVGQAATTPDRTLSLHVAELRARPGTRFVLQRHPRIQAIRALQGALQVVESGKQSGILRLSLRGDDPVRVVQILDTIAHLYVRQNVERHSEEAQKTLAFLETQLPQLRIDLEASEQNLNAYRARLGSVNLSLETEALLRSIADIETKLSELALQKVELKEKYTESHPLLVSLNHRRAKLEADRAALNGQIRKMPAEVQEAIRLNRDVRVNDGLYTLLLDKAQELRVVKAGTIGNVRILDAALPVAQVVAPQRSLVRTAGLVLGLVLGLLAAFVRRALFHGVEDPELLERATGLPVFASVPHSAVQGRQSRPRRRGGGGRRLLAAVDGGDLALESIRSLRTSLQFALLEARNNVVAIAGPSPAIGKSFVAANLAQTLAEAGKRTVLVDGDMRRGYLHDYFGLKRRSGLSGVIGGEVALERALHETGVDHLHFLPAGAVPPNPTTLLASERFEALVRHLSERYDMVLFDTPPILAVSDGALIGRFAGVNFVLLRSGAHHIKEIEHTIKRLRQNGIQPQGFIINDVTRRSGRYGYRYGGHAYHYQYSYK